MRIHITVILFLVTNISFCQTIKNIDNYLDSLTAIDSFSGYVLISQKSKPIFQKSYGYADRINKFPNTGSTQFWLSSTSKLFTGTAIVKLIQEERISVKDTIGKYITGLAYGNQVTIHHLLTHSSGLRDFYEDSTFSFEGVENCKDLIKFICRQSLSFKPGTNVKYSTTDMILLGAVIEKVSGKNFQQFITETIFKPLEMNNTTFVNYRYVQYEKFNPSAYAIGYVKDSTGNIVIRRKSWDNDPNIPLSAGGIWSCADDLLKFDTALHSGKIVNKKYLKVMLESKVQTEWPDTDFGYVWININRNKLTHAVGHGGNAGVHHNTFYRYDNDATTILILTNFGFADIFKISDEVEKRMFTGK